MCQVAFSFLQTSDFMSIEIPLKPNRRTVDVITAGRVAAGLFRAGPRIPEHQDAFSRIAGEELSQTSINVEEDVLAGMMGTIERRGLAEKEIDYKSPYWIPGARYSRLEMFGTLIQFTDFHDQRLPQTVLPPAPDVTRYINKVMSSDHPLAIPEQFEALLDITDGNAIGAANLGFIASRIMARGYDRRPYPEIVVAPENLVEWNKHIAKFEAYDGMMETDGPGDTYYFWTHFFAVAADKALGKGASSVIFQKVFEHGNSANQFVRRNIAGTPTQSPHQEAAILGRNMGLAVAKTLNL